MDFNPLFVYKITWNGLRGLCCEHHLAHVLSHLQVSLNEQQLRTVPLCTTAAITPGAIYTHEDGSTLSKIGTSFGYGPRTYGQDDQEPGSPGKGPGPYIGR